MKTTYLVLVTAICLCAEATKYVFAGDTLSFSEIIGDAAGKKQVRLKSDTPFNRSLIYDSTTLKIFEIEAPMTPRDSLEPNDMGILSVQWGVRDPTGNRYLNIKDLKKLGKRKIEAEALQRWIIGGKRVISNKKFRDFVNELRDSNIVSVPLEKGFTASEAEVFHGFGKISMTILIDREFVKFSYHVSPENEVEFLKKEVLIRVYSPKRKTFPGMPSFLTLANPRDSSAYEVWNKYTGTIRKYDYELFN